MDNTTRAMLAEQLVIKYGIQLFRLINDETVSLLMALQLSGKISDPAYMDQLITNCFTDPSMKSTVKQVKKV